jgi:imidazolonepropionase-like amidohydrolase
MKKTLIILTVFMALTVMYAMPQVQAEEKGEDIPRVILIKNVNVWDGTSDGLKKGFDVLVVGDKIRKVAKDIPATGSYEVDVKTKKSKSLVNSSVGFGYQLSVTDEEGDVKKMQIPVEVIDGKGGTLTPGLIDTHQHIMLPNGGPTDYKNKFDPYMNAHQSAKAAELMLLRGFTTIRDLMGPSVSLSKAIDQGLTAGPRLFSSQAAISATSGHADFRNYNDFHPNMQSAGFTDAWLAALGWAFLADGPTEVTRATRESLRMGATQIKVMAGGGVASLYDPLESVGYSVEEFRAAVNAANDYDTYVAIHAYNDESVLRAMEAGVLDCVHGHLLSEETVKKMAENGMWLSGMSKPPGLMEIPWFTDENKRKGKTILAGYDNVSKWAKKYGVKMAFGTDAAGSPEMMAMQLAEFEAREPFFTPVEIMRQATSNAAELLALSNSRNPWKEAPFGVIKEGAWADMLIYSANPLKDIKVVMDYKNNLKVVIKNGKIYKNTL